MVSSGVAQWRWVRRKMLMDVGVVLDARGRATQPLNFSSGSAAYKLLPMRWHCPQACLLALLLLSATRTPTSEATT